MEDIRFDFKDFELVAIVGAVDALHRECSEKNNGKRKKNFSVLFIFFFGERRKSGSILVGYL